MSTNSATIRARIEPQLKSEIEEIFEELGISTSDAIRLFFKQVKLHHGLPFEVKIPNKITDKALSDAQNRTDLQSVDSTSQLFEDLDI
jgi:DNA-damage-inducible protein J